MYEIIPAVLPKNYEDLKNKISLVRGIVPVVQIDICDGVFVKTVTWPFLSRAQSRDGEESFMENDLDQHFRKILNEEEGVPFWEDVDFEIDLMVADAVLNFDIYMKLGPRRVIFHTEAVGDLGEFRNFLEGIDTYVRDVVEIGVALSPSTPTENIFPLISCVDFVQVMGIEHEGVQGEEFDPKCLNHIKTLKEKFPDLIISVDGGVSLETAPEIISTGASRLIVGSAIFNTDDIIDTVERFKDL